MRAWRRCHLKVKDQHMHADARGRLATSHQAHQRCPSGRIWNLETSPFGQTVWPGHCRHQQTKAAKFKGNWQKLKGIRCLCNLICIHQLNYCNIDHDPELSAYCTYRTECKSNSSLTAFVQLFLVFFFFYLQT